MIVEQGKARHPGGGGGGVKEPNAPSKQAKKAWSKPTILRLEDGIVVVETGPNDANWVLLESLSYTLVP